jgi:hypothetical protein
MGARSCMESNRNKSTTNYSSLAIGNIGLPDFVLEGPFLQGPFAGRGRENTNRGGGEVQYTIK